MVTTEDDDGVLVSPSSTSLYELVAVSSTTPLNLPTSLPPSRSLGSEYAHLRPLTRLWLQSRLDLNPEAAQRRAHKVWFCNRKFELDKEREKRLIAGEDGVSISAELSPRETALKSAYRTWWRQDLTAQKRRKEDEAFRRRWSWRGLWGVFDGKPWKVRDLDDVYDDDEEEEDEDEDDEVFDLDGEDDYGKWYGKDLAPFREPGEPRSFTPYYIGLNLRLLRAMWPRCVRLAAENPPMVFHGFIYFTGVILNGFTPVTM